MPSGITLKCECCGFVEEFESPRKAFDKGWDCKPFFTQVVVCDLCPAAYIVLGTPEKHAVTHAVWEREGRPK